MTVDDTLLCPICMIKVRGKITKLLVFDKDGYQVTESEVKMTCGHIQETTMKIKIDVELQVLPVEIEDKPKGDDIDGLQK